MTTNPTDTNPHHVLPSSPYGITNTRYGDVDNPLIPLPQRNVMSAANRLNDFRYRRLSERQRVFIDVYLSSGFNAAEAAKRCGYCSDVPQDDKYERACGSIGRRLVKSQSIGTGIQLALEYHAERNKLNVDDLLLELRHVAFSNMGDFFVNDGTGEPRLQMPEDHERAKFAAISEITTETYLEGRGRDSREVKRVKFKLYDKLSAIDKLLKVAAAKGDPAVAGLNSESNNGAPTVNVFNILPVPSGEFLPASKVEESAHVLLQHETTKTLPPPLPPAPTKQTPPNSSDDHVEWGQPDREQRRSLTIDHEP